MRDYPRWKYHATKAAVVVPDEAAEKVLGDGWHNSPGEAKAAPATLPEDPKTKKGKK